MKKNLGILLSMSTLIAMGSACSKSPSEPSTAATASTSTTAVVDTAPAATPSAAPDFGALAGQSFVETNDCKSLKDHARYKKSNGAINSVYGAHVQIFASPSNGVGWIIRRMAFFSDNACSNLLFLETYNDFISQYEDLGQGATTADRKIKYSDGAGSDVFVSVHLSGANVVLPAFSDFGTLSTDVLSPTVVLSGTNVNKNTAIAVVSAKPYLTSEVNGSYSMSIETSPQTHYIVSLSLGAVANGNNGKTFTFIETMWFDADNDGVKDLDETVMQRYAQGNILQVRGSGEIADGSRKYELDVKSDQLITKAVFNSDVISSFNKQSTCGFNDWVQYGGKDITSASCETSGGVDPTDIKLFVEQSDATHIKVSGYFHDLPLQAGGIDLIKE